MFFDNRGKGKGQVSKGIWWMPWHQRAKKDAAGCENSRGAASKRRSVGIRMGQPILRKVGIFRYEYIVTEGKPREVKHLSTWRKRNQPRFP